MENFIFCAVFETNYMMQLTGMAKQQNQKLPLILQANTSIK